MGNNMDFGLDRAVALATVARASRVSSALYSQVGSRRPHQQSKIKMKIRIRKRIRSKIKSRIKT